MAFQTPRGTHDVLPVDSQKWQFLEANFRDLVGLYGYEEIRTPAFEETELFTRTSGDTSEIVTKQMYTFLDKGNRSMTLKPEGTAPVIRAFLQHQLGATGSTTRLWYMTQVFRYERPMKGRFRQHHQFGAELIGSQSPDADAEIIEVAVRFYQGLGIPNVSVLLNSIGRSATRDTYRELLVQHFQPFLNSCTDEDRTQALKNPLRMLDSKVVSAQELIASAPSILEVLEPESREHFAALQKLLDQRGIPYQINPRIVRGLDYYTDTVFEVQSEHLGSQSSLCGGGRYDGLVKELGGPPTPCVGFGMGIERLTLVLESLGITLPEKTLDVFCIDATRSHNEAVRSLASELRALGVSTAYDLEFRALKGQMKLADRLNAKYAAIIGDDEAALGVVTLRTLESGEQVTVPRQECVAKVKQWLASS